MRFISRTTVYSITMILALYGFLFGQDYQSQIDKLQNKQKELVAQMEEAKKAMDTNAYNNALQEFEKVKTELDRLKEKITSAQSEEAQAKIAFNKGGSLLKKHQYEEAVVEFDKAIALDPNYGNAYYMKGLALSRLKKYAEATTAYEKALEIDPNDSRTIFALGKLYEARGEGKKAISLYENALIVEPSNAKAAYSIGAVYVGWDAYSDAVNAFERAVKIDSTYDLAYTGWGTSLLELGRVNDAISKLKRAIALDPNNNDSYYRLAKAYNALGNYNEAIEAADKAIVLAKKSKSLQAAGHIEKGHALESMGRKADAKTVFQQAAILDKKWKEWVDHHIGQMQ